MGMASCGFVGCLASSPRSLAVSGSSGLLELRSCFILAGRLADFENRGGFEQSAGKKKAQEGNEPRAEKSGDRTPHETPAAPVNFAIAGTDGGDARGARGLGGANGRSADIAARVIRDSHP